MLLCGERSFSVLEEHHILPKYGVFIDGKYAPPATVTLRGNCHRKIHYMLKPLEEYNEVLKFAARKEELKGIFRFYFLLLDMKGWKTNFGNQGVISTAAEHEQNQTSNPSTSETDSKP